MARRIHYKIKTIYERGHWWANWLVKLEKKAFGWRYYGTETDVENEIVTDGHYDSWGGYHSRTRNVQKTYKWLQFRRVNPYSNNILFNLLEGICNILRWIKSRFGFLFMIAFLIIFLVEGFGGSANFEVTSIMAIILAANVGVSLVLCILATVLKKLFRIEEKCSESLAENGYDDDLDNLDYDE